MAGPSESTQNAQEVPRLLRGMLCLSSDVVIRRSARDVDLDQAMASEPTILNDVDDRTTVYPVQEYGMCLIILLCRQAHPTVLCL